MTEREAWLWLAALIEGTKGKALVGSDGYALSGLCIAVVLMEKDKVISMYLSFRMRNRIRRTNQRWLHRTGIWKDGVRRDWCLRFAKARK
jgi:hypothetical protein